MTGRSLGARRWRQLLLWQHIVTSVSWMALALTFVSLLTLNLTTADPQTRIAAASMTHHLDMGLLAPLANASAFTGFLLAASTPWGFFRHYWVLVKFTITVVQLNVGIFLLSDALAASEQAAKAGAPGPEVPLLIGTALMASAIGFQAWLSVAKPWGKVARPKPKLPTAPGWVFAGGVLTTAFDLAVGVLLAPAPVTSLVFLWIRLVARRRGSAAPRGAAGERMRSQEAAPQGAAP